MLILGLLLAILFGVAVILGPDILQGQNSNPRNPDSSGVIEYDHIASEAYVKEMWATATARANESGAAMAVTAEATPDATATLTYIYTHMDEFVKAAGTPTPTQNKAVP